MTAKRSSRGVSPSSFRQRGVVLVTSLIILLVMSLIGITAMQGVPLEERMAGHLRDATLASGAAEAALREAAEEIASWKAPPLPDDDAGSGVFTLGRFGATPQLGDLEGAAGVTGDAPGVLRGRRYAVEEYGFVPDDTQPESLANRVGVYYYGVTGLGFGSTKESRVLLQTVVPKRFN